MLMPPPKGSWDPKQAHIIVFYEKNLYNWRMQDDVMVWKRFPHCWPYVKRSHRRSMLPSHKGPVMQDMDVFPLSLSESCWTNINVTGNAISPQTLIFPDGALSFTGIQSRGEWLGYKLSSYATPWATPIYFWFDETYCTFFKSFSSHFKRAGKIIWWTDPNYSKEPHFSRNLCFVGTKINHKIISMG